MKSVAQNRWTRDELLVAFKLYCELPFGKMHSKNPEIIQLAAVIGRTPSSLAMKLTNFASLDPLIYLSGRKGLSGASNADRAMWDDANSDWGRFSQEAHAATKRVHVAFPDVESEVELIEKDDYYGETREAITVVRIGQALFRESVLSAYNYQCCITGLALRKLLVASHIVPWRSDKNNRLNPRNGLCLSSIHDRAFDSGFLSLSEGCTIMISKHLLGVKSGFVEDVFLRYQDRQISLPEKFAPDPAFLDFHRKEIFQP